MAKEVFGEYAAFTTQGGVRFQKNNKLISEKELPPEVVLFLKEKLSKGETAEFNTEKLNAEPKFPMPTDEEKARLREESLRVPEELKVQPELKRDDHNEPILTEADFEHQANLEQETLNQSVHEENLNAAVSPDFLESVSIHTAPLEAMAQALYDRFGIYTVFLHKLPVADEINPLTGEMFTKYHQGIAYQAAISVQARGLRNPELNRQKLDQDRSASQNFQEQFVPAPVTMGDARRANSFDYRTSAQGNKTIPTTRIVHEKDPTTGEVRAVQIQIPAEEARSNANSRYDSEEEQQIIEPPIFGTKSIIRPNW